MANSINDHKLNPNLFKRFWYLLALIILLIAGLLFFKFKYKSMISDHANNQKPSTTSTGQMNKVDSSKAKTALTRTLSRNGQFLSLPPEASKTRVRYPVDIESLLPQAEEFNVYGRHSGTHVEGYDHLGGQVKHGTAYKAMADGKVTAVEKDSTGQGTRIFIEYADGLFSQYDSAKDQTVKVGDTVKEGQEISKILPDFAGREWDMPEFWLYDKNRLDGFLGQFDWTNEIMSSVSSFDYLKPDWQIKISDWYTQNILPQLIKDNHSSQLAEPYLTNDLIIHKKYPNQIFGSWAIPKEKREYNLNIMDAITFLPADNEYFRGNKYAGVQITKNLVSGTMQDGTFDVDPVNHRLKIKLNIYPGSATKDLYAFYEIKEDASTDTLGLTHASLKIEFSDSSFPTTFSANARTYIEYANTGFLW